MILDIALSFIMMILKKELILAYIVKKKKVITVDYQYLQIYDIEFIDSIITIIVKIFSYDIYNIKNTEYDYLKKFINTDYIILFDSHSILN